ncbi:MAG: thiamine-phosphate kinase [Moorea sp. SIO2B7]|nr:thiamine-phosphate kinase [Moorena sp. SIO2B7]
MSIDRHSDFNPIPNLLVNNSSKIVKDIGEQGLLKRIQSFCPTDIVGDDGAVLAIAPGKKLVVTTDVLVDRVHFSAPRSGALRDCTTTPEDVGWRAAAANLSDLAAMGASPLGITVGLSLPGDVTVGWVEALYQGLNLCLKQYNTSILGGDICRSSVITVSITAFGQVLPNRVIRRCNAKPGDAIVVTGSHGASRAGLELLLHPESGQHLQAGEREVLIQAHQRPHPRLDCIPHLWNFVKKNSVAGMDSSDGLADAVVQICSCSGVGAEIERNSISLLPELRQFVSSEQALEWALYGGEDFELVLCLPQQAAQALVEKLGVGAAIIGQIIKGNEVKLVDSQGVYPQQVLSLAQGYQHF